jgi:hypothetical protein
MNAIKRAITLKIESPEGRKVFKRLIKTADCVIESYPVGYMKGIGLDYLSESQNLTVCWIQCEFSPCDSGNQYPFRGLRTAFRVTLGH